jgi:hypothetical protein
MHLHKQDLEKMLGILQKFPDTETVKVKQDSSSGIGTTTTMRFSTTVNNVEGDFIVTISGVENW